MIAMKRNFLVLTLCLACALAVAVRTGRPAALTDKPSPFAAFVDDYFDAHFAWNPSEGTAAGFHQYDIRLEDRSAPAVAKHIETLKLLQERLDKLRQGNLGGDEAMDGEVLDGLLRAQLLDLETLASWRKNPMRYISIPGEAVDGLMKRSFAPPAERLRSVIARLRPFQPCWMP
jgi:hypothetical protein